MRKTNPNKQKHNSQPLAGRLALIALVLLLGGFCLPPSTAVAGSLNLASIQRQADQQLLADYALRFWQKINQARRQPLAAAARLGLDESVVRTVFSDRPEVLEQGLPPLAWNGQLRQSASAHAADMLERNYYDYYSPENFGPYERIEATGYQPYAVGETIKALFFNNFVELEFALNQLVDSVLIEELTGQPDVQSNIFSPQVTEVGVSFSAQTANLQPDLPYVYLFVLDFAGPLQERRFVIINSVADHRIAMKAIGVSGWRYLQPLRPGVSQAQVSGLGAVFIAITKAGLGQLGVPYYLTGRNLAGDGNIGLDLSFEP